MGVAVCALGVMLLAFVRGGIEDIIGGGAGVGKGAKGYQAAERGGDELDEGSSSALMRDREEGEDSWGKMKRMLSNPLILSLMLWSFFYVSRALMVPLLEDLTGRRRAQSRASVDTW